MEAQLREIGWDFERVEAYSCDNSCGLTNRAMRSNWVSHENIIESIALGKYSGDVIVLEDDVEIRSADRATQALGEVKKHPWDCLYFFGADRLRAITHVLDCHAYAVNPQSAGMIVSRMRKYREYLERFRGVLRVTGVDRYFAYHLQKVMNYWGTEDLIVQNRERFGSDMGWGYNRTQLVRD